MRLGQFFKKICSFYIFFLFISCHVVGAVVADGGIIGKSTSIIYPLENSQYAVIDYFSGKEKMYIQTLLMLAIFLLMHLRNI